MNRPGPVGFTLLATFGLVATIEFRTVLSMVGIDVSTVVYFPVALTVLAVVLAGLYFLPGTSGGPDTKRGTEAEGTIDENGESSEEPPTEV